jgi:hypothetical protein
MKPSRNLKLHVIPPRITFAIAKLRSGEYAAEETKPLYQKLVMHRDRFKRTSELYSAWCRFMELGHYLEEKAEGHGPIAQRNVDRE